jgi:hypothetical protein
MAEFTVRVRHSAVRVVVIDAENSFEAMHKARNGEGEVSDPIEERTSFHIMRQKKPRRED